MNAVLLNNTFQLFSLYTYSGQIVTKYYFAGGTRIAMRKYTVPSSMVVEYLLSDHLGSTNITTDSNGAKASEIRYKPCPQGASQGRNPLHMESIPDHHAELQIDDVHLHRTSE
jgi:hypothetical protein